MKRQARMALRIAVALLMVGIGSFAWHIRSPRHSVRMSAFQSLAERSKPLVEAVYAYSRKHGHPPETLQALVPEFLPSIPSTGLGANREYRYLTPALDYDGNPWVITVFAPSGMNNFDQFMYFPLTNYPKTGYGGRLERVGDWAYVHE